MRFPLLRSAPVLAALVLLTLAPSAGADTLTNNTGLTAPGATITFSEVVLPPETPVTNQFAAFGATFAPNLFYNTQPLFFPTESLANFDSFGNTNNPASILFTQDVTAAAVAVQTNTGTTTFTALLNGSVVETFTAPTTLSLLPDTSQASNFYGFTNITFNELQILSDTGFFQIDNLQFTAPTAGAIPEPGTLALLGTGVLPLVGIMARRRRR